MCRMIQSRVPSLSYSDPDKKCYSALGQTKNPPNEDLPTMRNGDPLLQALFECEARLSAWMNESSLNAELFRRDPLAALRAADIGVNESLLLDLEETVTGLTRKLAG
jgi:hypothetical protein